MAVLKCKMCGANLQVEEEASVIECEYCGSRNTMPKLNDEKKTALFDRANFYRLKNEFDKAALIYENIVSEAADEAEAYWGICLCRYGVEYVEDPKTGKRVPTCRRAQFKSILDDEDYKSAYKHADILAKAVYKEEAEYIDFVQKGILEISSKEEPFDIFISYKQTDDNTGERTVDSLIAEEIYDELTAKGYKVFFSMITLEDKLGMLYEPYIFAALNSARIMLVLGTSIDYFNAVWVKNEWSRYLTLIEEGAKKTIIPCYKNISPYELPKEFVPLQSQDVSKVGWKQDLMRGIEKILGCVKSVELQNNISQNAIQGKDSFDELTHRGETFVDLERWEEAQQVYQEIADNYPDQYEGWWGLILCHTRGLKQTSDNAKQIGEWYTYVRKTASQEKLIELEKEYIYYVGLEAGVLKSETESNLEQEQEKNKQLIEGYEKSIATIKKSKENMSFNFANIIRRYNRYMNDTEKELDIANESLAKYPQEKKATDSKAITICLAGVAAIIMGIIVFFTADNFLTINMLVGPGLVVAGGAIFSAGTKKMFDPKGDERKRRENSIKKIKESLENYKISKNNRSDREKYWNRYFDRLTQIFEEEIATRKRLDEKFEEYLSTDNEKRLLAWYQLKCSQLNTTRSIVREEEQLEEIQQLTDQFIALSEEIESVSTFHIIRDKNVDNNASNNVWIESVDSNNSTYSDGSGGVFCDRIDINKNIVIRFSLFLKKIMRNQKLELETKIYNEFGELVQKYTNTYEEKAGKGFQKLTLSVRIRDDKGQKIYFNRGKYYAVFRLGNGTPFEYCFEIY